MFFSKEPTYAWEQEFAAAASRAFGHENLTFDDAVNVLRAADGRQLLAFAERARRWQYVGSLLTTRDRSRAMLKEAWREPGHADVYLFFEACGSNGHLREQAIRALRGYPGRLACAAALIRSEDWVTQVVDAAARLLYYLAETDAATHLFALLDLIVLLRLRQRFAERWENAIAPLLSRPQWRNARRQALASPGAAARRCAHEIGARADPDLLEEHLRSAMNDRSALVAQFALDRMNSLTIETRRATLHDGLRHPLGSIRAAALHRYHQERFEDAREVLVAALMDPSSSVRGSAAYQLAHQYEVDALPLWRAAFDAGRDRNTMTAALAENGDVSDVERLRSQLDDARSRVRAAALSGLLRIGAPDAGALAARAIRDRSTAVARAAIRSYSRGTETLEESMLRDAFAHADNARLRSRYISMSTLLSKWSRLEFLLGLYSRMSPADWHQLDTQVDLWAAKFNRSYAQPGVEQRLALQRSVEDLSKLHPVHLWQYVRRLL